jgi:hypothetical protein
MFNIFAIPDIVGFVGLSFKQALASVAFFAVSVNIFTNSSRVSGFLVSLPDILSPLRSLCRILYIRVSEKINFFIAVMSVFRGKVSVRCCAIFF